MARWRVAIGLMALLPLAAWADMSPTQGHRLAVMALGHDVKAYLRLDVAAHAGDAVAMNWLGAYWESAGDPLRARSDYLRAATSGNRTAALNLGYLYRFGRGVPENPAQAVVWYRRAAQLGSAHALAELGNAYYLGQGVRQDRTQAYRWYWLAARRSPQWRSVLGALAAEIGPSATARAKDAARAWLTAREVRP
ncbi:hypothetical protein BI364_14950 [Acidihalobacter yilgarnensis]|uniref:Sel1 repeat family protein n=1 Tax=Acidihalobacter yilgarnensis TaxID=2819280 RepID=A0A1D8IRP3_9GAMM|nr:tetratricopeptide repeat protein [Acidihalobacter yilgarnensis]AOU99065.1 hypothetical protein BI364_14950 [Acidihalobacter yilgarnensis]